MASSEIDELIEAAREKLRKWRRPSYETRLTNRSMQELLDNRKAPPGA